jgi:hypothetical protein
VRGQGVWRDRLAVVSAIHLRTSWLAKENTPSSGFWTFNVVRSAINRYMEDHGRGRPALGFTVAQVIKTFKFAKERQKRDNDEDVALNRQFCRARFVTPLPRGWGFQI